MTLIGVEGMVGSVEVARVLESTLSVSAARWFPSFDRDAIRPHEHWLCPTHFDASTGQFPMPVQSFVLRTDRHVILIDTCVGNHKNRAGVASMHMLDQPYLDRLAALGLAVEDIDYVMCTHLHVDHVGWNTKLVDGRWIPTFPNATYVISRSEYEATKAEAALPDAPPYARNSFADSVLPIVESGRHLFVQGLDQLLDIFTFRPAPGHSPGNMQIELRSGGDCAIFAGDILHSALQVPFWQWSSLVCSDPRQAAISRRALLERCVEENAVLIPGHFAAPYVARIGDDHGIFAAEFGW